MTSDILQSDIALATRLRDEQRPDDEILRALMSRGVDSAKAAQLLDDLRHGREVRGRSTLAPELGLRRRSRAASTPVEGDERPPTPAPPVKPRNRTPPRAPHRHESPRTFPLLFLALVALAVVVVGLVLFQRFKANRGAGEEPGPAPNRPKATGTAPKAPATAVAPVVPPTPLVLELQREGLRLGGRLLPRNNLLPAVCQLLGAPSRTNKVTRTGTVIYAYDPWGLLVYTQPDGKTNSIVLDCEANSGVNGTTSAFAGSLKVENRVIGPDMDSSQLAAIAALGLRHPGGSESVWNGRYHDLDLVFAYLKTPQRLSLIEIDFK